MGNMNVDLILSITIEPHHTIEPQHTIEPHHTLERDLI